MAVFRPISTSIWRDKTFKKLDTSEKTFWFFLLTNHHTNQSGIYKIDPGEISLYSGLSISVCQLLLKRFEAQYDLIKYDWDHEEICLLNWYKHHTNDSPNVLKCIQSELEGIESYNLVQSMQGKCRVKKIKTLLLNKQKSLKMINGIDGGVQEECKEGQPSQGVENQQGMKQLASKEEKEEEKEKEREREEGKNTLSPSEDFQKKIKTPKQMTEALGEIVSSEEIYIEQVREVCKEHNFPIREFKIIVREVYNDYESKGQWIHLQRPDKQKEYLYFRRILARCEKFIKQRQRTSPKTESKKPVRYLNAS